MSSIFFHLYIFCFFLSRCTHTRRTVHETNLNTCSLFLLFFLATVIPRSFVSFMVPGCLRLGFCQIYPSIVCIGTCRVWYSTSHGMGNFTTQHLIRLAIAKRGFLWVRLPWRSDLFAYADTHRTYTHIQFSMSTRKVHSSIMLCM